MENQNSWLLLANGLPLSPEKLCALAVNKKVMALDGAYLLAKQAGIKVDILLGDFDSISPELLQAARASGVEVIPAPDQNYSDLEKGIHYLDKLSAKDILICAATGRRLQHTLHNLSVLKKLHNKKRALLLLTEIERVYYIENCEWVIDGKIGESVGVLGFPDAVVSSKGLKYEMNDLRLLFEQRNSVCNELVSERGVLKIQGGVLVIYEVG